MSFQKRIEQLLEPADITVNGNRPWDISVNHKDLFRRLLAHGSLGLGESYMEGWWDCERVDELVCRLFAAGIDRRVRTWGMVFSAVAAQIANRQSRSRAFQVGRNHYDIGNDLYERMLDSRMVYSCAYWKEAENLDTAQEHKLDLVCRKLLLERGLRLLDIGCGWGGLARFAAERYGVQVVGVTVSHEQLKVARQSCSGLSVDIRLQDYRDLHGTFDRIVSIGMFEHVGYKNYRTFMEVVERCLTPGGLFLLQTIGGNESVTTTDPWIERYIFPNGMLPSAVQIASAVEKRFYIQDWHDFGPDYDRTLMAWWQRFEDAWADLAYSYGERFHRMWRFYLLSCAGAFRARVNQLWQIVLVKKGMTGCNRPER